MIRLSCCSKGFTNFIPRECNTLADLRRVFGNSKELWSPSIYKDNYRNEENFISSDLICLDFDDGVTVETIKNRYKDYWNYMYATKSHQKEKTTNSGVVKPACDRFRIIFKLSETITDKKTWDLTIAKLMKSAPDADQQPKDCCRLWYGGVELSINKGKPITVVKENAIPNLVMVVPPPPISDATIASAWKAILDNPNGVIAALDDFSVRMTFIIALHVAEISWEEAEKLLSQCSKYNYTKTKEKWDYLERYKDSDRTHVNTLFYYAITYAGWDRSEVAIEAAKTIDIPELVEDKEAAALERIERRKKLLEGIGDSDYLMSEAVKRANEVSLPFATPKLCKLLTARPHRFTLVSGLPGRGKTTFVVGEGLGQIALGNKVLFALFETPEDELWQKIGSTVFNTLTPTDVQIDILKAQLKDKLFLIKTKTPYPPRLLLDQIVAAHTTYGIQWIYIDNPQRFLEIRSASDERIVHEHFVTDMCTVLEQFPIHIVCVCHLRKPMQGQDEIPSENDIRNSGKYLQECDNQITVHRYKNEKPKGRMHLNIGKSRHTGSLGTDLSFYVTPESNYNKIVPKCPKGITFSRSIEISQFDDLDDVVSAPSKQVVVEEEEKTNIDWMEA